MHPEFNSSFVCFLFTKSMFYNWKSTTNKLKCLEPILLLLHSSVIVALSDLLEKRTKLDLSRVFKEGGKSVGKL